MNFSTGRLSIRRSVSWAKLRGQTDSKPRFYEPKTTAGKRTIELAPELVHALKVWKLACLPSRLNLVFPTEEGTPKHRSTITHHALRPPPLKAAGLRQVTLHSLRRTCASALILAGTDCLEVAKFLDLTRRVVARLRCFRSAIRSGLRSAMAVPVAFMSPACQDFPAAMSVAAVFPPHAVTAFTLLGAAALTLYWGLVSERRAFVRWAGAPLFVSAGAAAFWPLSISTVPSAVRMAVVLLGVAALVGHTFLTSGQGREPYDEPHTSTRVPLTYFALALATAAALLWFELATVAACVPGWEREVVEGFADAFVAGRNVLTYATRCLLWQEGVLSTGNISLFYGAPTYALFHLVGFSTWSLRAMSVLDTLLSVVIIYTFGRRFFNPFVGAASATLLAVNQCVLFYGRYGSSPAGSTLAVLLAMWSTWFLLEQKRWTCWRAGLCALTLYVATLQYAPARISVLILLGVISLLFVGQVRLWRYRIGGALALTACAIAVWKLQGHFGTQGAFYAAHGEQIFAMVQNPQSIRMFGQDLISSHARPEDLTTLVKLRFVYRLLENTVPQYLELIGPAIQIQTLNVPGEGGLPRLYYAPLALFVAWGSLHSLIRLRSWRHFCLLALVAGSTLPLLLTNRVDSNRMMLFVIPISLWAALGLWEAAKVLERACVPPRLQHLLAAALVLSVVYNDVTLPHEQGSKPPPASAVLLEESATIPEPVFIGGTEDEWLHLAMLERTRQDPTRFGTLLGTGLLHPAHLRPLIDTATLLLTPAERFRVLGTALQLRGARVAERGTKDAQILRIDAGAAATGIPDEQIRPLPTPEIRSTPTPVVLRQGPHVSLTALQPLKVTFGAVPPRIDQACDDGPIVMGGVRYDDGIGTLAWCQMTYEVPSQATTFQAIIGLSDRVHNCDVAAVTFEVRGENDELLYDSGFIAGTDPPRPVAVDVRHTKTITLVTTEGGNGANCDYANWAVPEFFPEQ